MAETVGATNTRIFLWRFVAETDSAVKGINHLHKMAQALAAQTAAATKKAQAAQNQMAQGAAASGKSTIRSLAVTGVGIGAAVTLWYQLRRIMGSVIEDTDRMTRALMMSGESFRTAGTSAYRLLDVYTRISGVSLPEMIDATEELISAGVRGEKNIASLAETSVKMAYALGLPAKEVSRTFGMMQASLGLTTEQVNKQANAMVLLVREGKATASMLLTVAQNTIFATKVTGIATLQFMAMAAAMEKSGLSANDAAAATTEWANMLSEDFGSAAAPFVDLIYYQKQMADGAEGVEKALRHQSARWMALGKTEKERIQIARVMGMSQKLAIANEAALGKNLQKTIDLHKKAIADQERSAAVNDAFADAMGNLSGSLKEIANNIKGFAIAAGALLMPVLNAMLWPLKVITNLFAMLPGWIKMPIGALGMLVIGAVGLIFALGQLAKVVGIVNSAWVAGLKVLKVKNAMELATLVLTKLHTFWVTLFNAKLRAQWIEQTRLNIVNRADMALRRAGLAVLTLWAALTTGQTASIKANTSATVVNTSAGWMSVAVRWAIAGVTGVVTAATWLWNTAMGVSTAILTGLSVAGSFMGGVLLFLLAPLWAIIAATWAWTVALLANPITWIVLAVVAAVALLVGVFMLLYTYWDKVWSFIMMGVNAVVWAFKMLWNVVVSGVKWALKHLWLFMGPFGWLFKAVGWLKKKLFGSGFLHIDEGVTGAIGSLRKLTNAYGAVGSAAASAYDRASGEVTVGTAVYPGAKMVGGIGAGAVPGAGGAGGVAGVRPGGGVSVKEINIPITLVLDGRVIAETIVKVGKEELLRMHSLPRRTMRGVPALG